MKENGKKFDASLLIDENGDVLTKADDKEQIVYADIDKSELAKYIQNLR